MASVIDAIDRPLSANEAKSFPDVENALSWWLDYFASEDGTPVETMDEARKLRGPITTRGAAHPEDSTAVPMAVHTGWAREWCRRAPTRGRIVPTVYELEAALEWMRCIRATTFFPAGEQRTTPRRPVDPHWWRLDAERSFRLREGRWVPVLTGYPGPRRKEDPSAMALLRRRTERTIAAAVDPDELVALVREYLRIYEPTVQMAEVVRAHRPLAMRRRQRPSRLDAFAAYRDDLVLVHDNALAHFSQESSGRRGKPPVPESTMHLAMRALRSPNGHPAFTEVTTVRAADMNGRTTRGARWSCVEMELLGPDVWVDFDTARGEAQLLADTAETERANPSGIDPATYNLHADLIAGRSPGRRP